MLTAVCRVSAINRTDSTSYYYNSVKTLIYFSLIVLIENAILPLKTICQRNKNKTMMTITDCAMEILLNIPYRRLGKLFEFVIGDRKFIHNHGTIGSNHLSINKYCYFVNKAALQGQLKHCYCRRLGKRTTTPSKSIMEVVTMSKDECKKTLDS